MYKLNYTERKAQELRIQFDYSINRHILNWRIMNIQLVHILISLFLLPNQMAISGLSVLLIKTYIYMKCLGRKLIPRNGVNSLLINTICQKIDPKPY